nr:hypothetical protein CFP56_69562 [Quercus suber]
MSSSNIPDEAPPSYSTATGASANSKPTVTSSHLNVPGAESSSSGIPPSHRRSMEDEQRPLPKGWVRTYDPTSNHQFFVDTTADPPRSTWHHPYDDDEYLSTLSGEERERIEQESLGRGHPISNADIIAHHTDEEDEDDQPHHSMPSRNAELPPRPSAGAGAASDKGKGKQTFGRKLKDRVTGTTHEERARERARRDEEERNMYEQHLRIRAAMSKAAQTGQPQLLGKDRNGKDVYVEPPAFAGGAGMYRGGGYGFNPYGSGLYAPPNAMYMRPRGAYGRPYGGGFGGGYGMPLAVGGGLMGGLLLGSMF